MFYQCAADFLVIVVVEGRVCLPGLRSRGCLMTCFEPDKLLVDLNISGPGPF